VILFAIRGFFYVKPKNMDLIFKKEVYRIVGICMGVQKILGYGFSEIVYKDAMEIEFIENTIPYIREDELLVHYKGRVLKHSFNADFVLFGSIIVEVKASEEGIIDKVISQTLNYLKASGCKVGLIINFGRTRMEYRRLVM
jgi:GxxExxY protein